LVNFAEIPKKLVNAVLAAEDKHFFEHMGFDVLRIGKAAYVNLKTGRKEQGGSTLTMQLARNLYLDADKNWRRKLSEFAIAVILEHKLSKQAIFEFYANQVYLGRHNTFSIHGFGEASRAFFDKDVPHLTLAECALLAGMIQRPSYLDPVHHADRALERRNLTLALMRQNGFISAQEEEAASQEPLKLRSPRADSEAPYFIALASDELHTRVKESPGLHISRVYTTLDPGLQSAALDAVRIGMAEVDKRLTPHRKKRGAPVKRPQVALIALDPHTGEVKAVVGGREYGVSQLNHVLAKRQPGSVFKPFVYAAALSKQNSGQPGFTCASTVVDEPKTFHFDNAIYEPTNHGEHFYGRVTFRTALAKSMNVAAVSVAEQVGYKNVVDLAHHAGLNEAIQPTPAIALGAYETTPLEIGGAYTIFANSGIYVKPSFVSEVRASDGNLVLRSTPQQRRVLDPKVAFLMQEMLREVLRSGTGAGVKSRGLTAEAAGKTGTSRDGWFAGFTSDLLCVVWVGYDENEDLDLEGAKSALPIWTEFMKRAAQRGYAGELPKPPPGIVAVFIDPGTGLLAGSSCERRQTEYFISGSAPRTWCAHERQPEVFDITENPASLTRTAQSQTEQQ
jgi:penicillin-binding protein 1B